jgi:hypothetical protein
MAVSDLSSSDGHRIGCTDDPNRAQTRAKRVRTMVQIGTSFSVLLLIMLSALIARLLLSLPYTVAH